MTDEVYCHRIDANCPHSIDKDKNTGFVIMAYSELYSPKIEDMLRKAVKSSFNLKPVLARDIRHTGSTDIFCTKICRPIKESTLCIADLTYANTNVGAETFLAHKFEKPVIITRYIQSKTKPITPIEKKELERIRKQGKIQYKILPQDLPTDILSVFRVDYSNLLELKRKLKEGFQIEKR